MMGDGVAKIKVSVLVPVYNTRRYLAPCMESLLAQTLGEIEIIVVDDGSTDGSDRILASFAARDDRIQILRQPNRGLGATRNAGLDAARGEYVAFVDSDDWVDPQFCEAMVNEADRVGADLAICDFHVLRDGAAPEVAVVRHPPGARGKEDLLVALLGLRIPGFSWNKLYRRSVIEANGLRFPMRDQLENVEDQYFSLRAVHHAERIAFVERALVHYRVHQDSIVQRYQRTAFRDVVELYRLNAALVAQRGSVPSEKEALQTALLMGVFGCMLNECKESNPKSMRARGQAFSEFARHESFREVYDHESARRSLPWQRRLILGAVRYGWSRLAYVLCQAYWSRVVRSGS